MIEYKVTMRNGNEYIGEQDFPNREFLASGESIYQNPKCWDQREVTADLGEAIRHCVHTANRTTCECRVYSPTTGKTYWDWNKGTDREITLREAGLLPLHKTVEEWLKYYEPIPA